LSCPYGVAVDAGGNLYIADTFNSRIRKVSNGVITTVAGSGGYSYGGDNGPATSAKLNSPSAVAVDAGGNLYIADTTNDRIRKVSNGVITTVAGGGSVLGDNGPATSAQLSYPQGIAVDAAGNLYIGDTYNQRVREVSNGVITTVAGNGMAGFSGDNGAAPSAELDGPEGIAVDAAGNLYVADTGNGRIRVVSSAPLPLSISTPSTLPSGFTGTAYWLALAAAGGVPPYTWAIAGGALPPGLVLSSAGTIGGSATAVEVATFSVTVTDANSSATSRSFSLSIGLAPLTITTSATLPSGLTGAAYSQTLAAAGGAPPYAWSLAVGALPAGLVLSSGGVVAGTPTALGTATFSVTVTDSSLATASQWFSITISPPALAISTPSTLPSGLAGTAYSQTLAATGGYPPYTWSVVSGALPAGLSLSSAGAIAGIPATPGITAFTADVSDASLHYVSQSFTLTVAGPALTVATPSTLPFGATGTAYSQTLAATGGVPPYTWSILSGTLPPGLTLSSAGALTGIPTVAGSYIFTAQVQDSVSSTTSQTFGLTVSAPGALPRLGVIPQVATGGGWTTTIWLINRTSALVQTSLVFHGDNGAPLTLPLNVTQPGITEEADVSTLNEVIAPNTTLVVATEAPATNVEGWADVLSNGALSGFAIFSNGTAEGAVPLQAQIGNSISLPFDNTGGASTGIALVNLAGAQANITAIVWDQNGSQLASVPVALTDLDSNGNGHDSFMLPARLAVTAGIRGIVQFVGNPGTAQVPAGQLTGLGLRADTSGLFTSIPTIVP
jgi:hypothetical protein